MCSFMCVRWMLNVQRVGGDVKQGQKKKTKKKQGTPSPSLFVAPDGVSNRFGCEWTQPGASYCVYL